MEQIKKNLPSRCNWFIERMKHIKNVMMRFGRK